MLDVLTNRIVVGGIERYVADLVDQGLLRCNVEVRAMPCVRALVFGNTPDSDFTALGLTRSVSSSWKGNQVARRVEELLAICIARQINPRSIRSSNSGRMQEDSSLRMVSRADRKDFIPIKIKAEALVRMNKVHHL